MIADQSQPRLRFAGVGKHFHTRSGEHWALQDIDLSVWAGQFVAIVGPSGCGKSTLLNLMAGLIPPSTGSVEYDGKPVHDVNTEVAYVTQADNLLPWRTTQANIALPLEIRGLAREAREAKVGEMVSLVGLKGFENHYPAQLSGGMRKRTTLARALAYRTDTWLMDEPFAALDAQLKFLLQTELLALWTNFAATVLFVTHDIAEAITLADRIVVMGTGPGHVKEVFDVPFARPRDALQIRRDPSFGDLHDSIWKLLQSDLAMGAAPIPA